jgi:hypothetical protein
MSGDRLDMPRFFEARALNDATCHSAHLVVNERDLLVDHLARRISPGFEAVSTVVDAAGFPHQKRQPSLRLATAVAPSAWSVSAADRP